MHTCLAVATNPRRRPNVNLSRLRTAGSLLRQAVTETDVRPQPAADHTLHVHRRLRKTVRDMSSCIFSNG